MAPKIPPGFHGIIRIIWFEYEELVDDWGVDRYWKRGRVKTEDVKFAKVLTRVASNEVPSNLTSCAIADSPCIIGKQQEEVQPLLRRPVYLNIYDCGQEKCVSILNKALGVTCLGGIYHAAVEVDGLEWSFDGSPSRTTPGLRCFQPRCDPDHVYRQTVKLGETDCSPEDIAEIVSQMLEEYPGDDYDILTRNCCNFADDFSRRLGLHGIPGWVSLRLARAASTLQALALQVSCWTW
ncbi:unnamed protein product [Symbiodinium natans]|uniref:PPPDE domain-containing protein n=1 Tax=Symbiodinium natans TaxID=878477 RepID=A0A812NFZ6_9DINO|nr:unnamed protein product [Symbiodinium natans]